MLIERHRNAVAQTPLLRRASGEVYRTPPQRGGANSFYAALAAKYIERHCNAVAQTPLYLFVIVWSLGVAQTPR